LRTSAAPGTPEGSADAQAMAAAGPMASTAPALPQASVTPMGTTDPAAGADPAGGAPATSRHHKGAHHVAVALGGHDLGAALIGHRHPRGPKSPKGGSTGDATNHPISDPLH
jgi:hypothetical protein